MAYVHGMHLEAVGMEGEGRIPTTQSHDDHMGSAEADDEEGEDGTLVAADASLVHALLEGEPSADDETHFDLERFAPRSSTFSFSPSDSPFDLLLSS